MLNCANIALVGSRPEECRELEELHKALRWLNDEKRRFFTVSNRGHARSVGLADAVLLCFNRLSSESLRTIKDEWVPTVKDILQARPKVPLILIGYQLTEKRDIKIYNEAMSMVEQIGALNYIECNVTVRVEVVDVYLAAAVAVIDQVSPGACTTFGGRPIPVTALNNVQSAASAAKEHVGNGMNVLRRLGSSRAADRERTPTKGSNIGGGGAAGSANKLFRSLSGHSSTAGTAGGSPGHPQLRRDPIKKISSASNVELSSGGGGIRAGSDDQLLVVRGSDGPTTPMGGGSRSRLMVAIIKRSNSVESNRAGHNGSAAIPATAPPVASQPSVFTFNGSRSNDSLLVASSSSPQCPGSPVSPSVGSTTPLHSRRRQRSLTSATISGLRPARLNFSDADHLVNRALDTSVSVDEFVNQVNTARFTPPGTPVQKRESPPSPLTRAQPPQPTDRQRPEAIPLATPTPLKAEQCDPPAPFPDRRSRSSNSSLNISSLSSIAESGLSGELSSMSHGSTNQPLPLTSSSSSFSTGPTTPPPKRAFNISFSSRSLRKKFSNAYHEEKPTSNLHRARRSSSSATNRDNSSLSLATENVNYNNPGSNVVEFTHVGGLPDMGSPILFHKDRPASVGSKKGHSSGQAPGSPKVAVWSPFRRSVKMVMATLNDPAPPTEV